MKLSEK